MCVAGNIVFFSFLVSLLLHKDLSIQHLPQCKNIVKISLLIFSILMFDWSGDLRRKRG